LNPIKGTHLIVVQSN